MKRQYLWLENLGEQKTTSTAKTLVLEVEQIDKCFIRHKHKKEFCFSF